MKDSFAKAGSVPYPSDNKTAVSHDDVERSYAYTFVPTEGSEKGKKMGENLLSVFSHRKGGDRSWQLPPA